MVSAVTAMLMMVVVVVRLADIDYSVLAGKLQCLACEPRVPFSEEQVRVV